MEKKTWTCAKASGKPVRFCGREVFYVGDHKAMGEVIGSAYNTRGNPRPDPHQTCGALDWEWIWMADEPVFMLGKILERVRRGDYKGLWVHEPWLLDVGPNSLSHVICVAIFHATVKACFRVVSLLKLCTELRANAIWRQVVRSITKATNDIKKDICTTGKGLMDFLGKNERKIKLVSSQLFSGFHRFSQVFKNRFFLHRECNTTPTSFPIPN